MIKDIKANPLSSNGFFAVGSHKNPILGTDTAFIMEFEVLDTYVSNVLSYKKLHSDYSTTGTTNGFASIDFDANAENLIVSGIIKDSTATKLVSVFTIDSSLSNVNWIKYLNKKSTSTLSMTVKEIYTHYYESGDSIAVVYLSSSFNSTTYATDNMINVYSLNFADGALQWELQLSDHSGERFSKIKSIINPFYDELVLFYSTTGYQYYHVQAINMADGSFGKNVQYEITYHYQLSGMATFKSNTSNFESDDVMLTGVSGYITKMNTKRANLEIVDTTSTLRPLHGIHYNSFTLPLTTPTDLEWLSYSPSNDFLIDDTGYEVNSQAYEWAELIAPTLTEATEMAIGFETTDETVSMPNNGVFYLSQPYTKDNLLDDQLNVTFELYNFSE